MDRTESQQERAYKHLHAMLRPVADAAREVADALLRERDVKASQIRTQALRSVSLISDHAWRAELAARAALLYVKQYRDGASENAGGDPHLPYLEQLAREAWANSRTAVAIQSRAMQLAQTKPNAFAELPEGYAATAGGAL